MEDDPERDVVGMMTVVRPLDDVDVYVDGTLEDEVGCTLEVGVTELVGTTMMVVGD